MNSRSARRAADAPAQNDRFVERRRGNERRSEALHLHDIADAVTAHVAVLDGEGVIVGINAAWESFADDNGLQAPDRGRGANYLHVCDDAARTGSSTAAEAAQGIRAVLAGQARRFELQYPCHSPTQERWFVMRVSAVADGSRPGAVVMHEDITTRVQTARELARVSLETERRERMLNTALSSISDYSYIFDTRCRLLFANQTLLELWGLSLEQAIGKNLHDLGYPADTARTINAQVRSVFATGVAVKGELAYVSPAGARGFYAYEFSAAFAPDGRIDFVVGCSSDITQRKRDQDALRELNAELEDRVRVRTAELDLARSDAESANRAKSEFLATMSHEIRTPMSGMLGLLELLELGSLGVEERTTLSVARESGKALMRIIDDILDFSRIEANGLQLNLVAGSVASVVANTCRLHAQVAAAKNLEVRADVSAQISPLLSFDPLRLGQILNNFLNNAIKFTPAGGVYVSVELVQRLGDMEELCFVVRDTGIGMTAGQVGRLFRPFVQAAAETSARFGGTGLGLVICRRLAELMGGTVEAESEPGVGTSMRLRLPFEICQASGPLRLEEPDQEALRTLVAGRRVAPSAEAARADGTLLLIVDDHPTNRMVLLRQAALLGYAAQTADDGAQAFLAWRTGRFAAVLTDCSMPILDGYQLARAIREAEAKAQGEGRGEGMRIPIIACTANALPPAAQACADAGMDACLVKPASLKDLSALLARWVPLPGEPPVTEAAAIAGPSGGRVPALLDTGLLAEITGGDPVAQAEVLLDFRHATGIDASALREAVVLPDFARIAQSTHRIKGSSLMLGATLLADACARIEAAAAAHDATALATAMGSFEVELVRLYGYLDALPIVERQGTSARPVPR